MEKIFDIAKDKEQSWGTLATAIDGNFDEIRLQINTHHGEDYTEELTDNNMYIETGFPIGTTISLEPTSGGGYVYIILDCKQGDKYIVSGRGGSRPRTYAFVDSSNVLQEVSGVGEILEDSILIAPCDGKIIYNCDKAHTPKKVYKVGVIEDNLAEINNKIERECLKKSLTRTSNLFNSKEYRYDGYYNDSQEFIKSETYSSSSAISVKQGNTTYSGNTEKSTIKRWKKIANSVARLKMEYGIDFIIPYGTAIENLRASSLNNEMELTEDGVHCAEGLPMYCASCCYYQALFAPRYGISIFGNTLRLTSSAPHAINVTDSNAPIAQKAAISSCCNMWECINPETIEL